jgi:DNA-directed RNA polymerase specialized sigma24 family protein
MITVAQPVSPSQRHPTWQPGFMALLPDMMRHAGQAFRCFGAEARNEAIQEVLVSALLAYVRLHQRGMQDVAYAGVLTRYAVAQYFDGRRAAAKLNCKDVLSPYARRIKGIQVESLDSYSQDDELWREIVVEDQHAGPAETAAVRMDFGQWLASLPCRDRRLADALSDGSTAKEIAQRFGVSPGRVSQKRREFLASWQEFQAEPAETVESRVAS